MKFCVGYQVEDERGFRFAEKLLEYKDHISEVYFSWDTLPSGRSNMKDELGFIHWEMQEILTDDLRLLKKNGIGLNLLFNGNCYGGEAISDSLKNKVRSVIEYLEAVGCGVDTITTTSPFIASIVKEYYPNIRVRSSVNMRICDVRAMEYLEKYFDEFYVQREYNRKLEHIKRMKAWCDERGKGLSLLANSGCMKFCSGQIFHDNLVSHESENVQLKNTTGFYANICHDYYKDREKRYKLISNTWIRPEDIHLYEGLVDNIKLATRMTSRPMSVVRAYVEGSYIGNVLDLLEPNHTSQLGTAYLSNKKFPKDFAQKMQNCNDDCENCNYCKEVYDMVLTVPKIPTVE